MKSKKIKKWTYAVFVFNLTGAIYAHICMSDPTSDTM